MAKAQMYLCLIIFVYLSSGKNFLRVEGQKDWCVANAFVSINQLYRNINFACSKIDCRSIRKGGACFLPDNPYNHASFAMNLYYQAHGRNHAYCNFEGSAAIAHTNPSYGSCQY